MGFNENLKSAMQEAKLTQAELVRLTGVPKGTLSQYLSGRMEPKADRVSLFEKALGVPDGYLLKEQDKQLLEIQSSYIHRISLKELAERIGVSSQNLAEAARNGDLPGLYACKGKGSKYFYIINEAVFCRV